MISRTELTDPRLNDYGEFVADFTVPEIGSGIVTVEHLDDEGRHKVAFNVLKPAEVVLRFINRTEEQSLELVESQDRLDWCARLAIGQAVNVGKDQNQTQL